MQGGFATSRPNREGKSIPHTLDEVRLGRSKYVTLASAASNYGKWYKIPTLRYRSPIDGQTYTMSNVVGYVHDTGCAFNGSCPNYGGKKGMFSSQPRPDKFDIAVGDFRGKSDGQAMSIVSGSTASRTWFQIGGPVGINTVTNLGPSPYTVGYPTTIGYPPTFAPPTYNPYGGPVYSQDYYCITSIEPIIVIPVPAGTQFPSNCYNNQSQYAPPRPPLPPPQMQQAPLAQMQQPVSRPSFPAAQPTSVVQTPIGSQSSVPYASTPQAGMPIVQQLMQALKVSPPPAPVPFPKPAVPSIQSVATIFVQPRSVSRGNPVLVSWSSVGTSQSTPCTVRTGNITIAQKSEGSKVISTTPQTARGTMTFTLSCMSQSGDKIERSASTLIE